MLTDEDALRAAADPAALERAIQSNQSFILRSAGKAARRYVTQSDDEWSVALSAFAEAVTDYDPGKGRFTAFASLVIGRRVTDWLRAQSRYAPERSMPPAAFCGVEENGVPPLPEATSQRDDSLRLELETLCQVLAHYGVRFSDLVKTSPKAAKTRAACAQAVRLLLAKPDLLALLRHTGGLPLAELTKSTGLPRKILERHRKYIIAAAEILDGDYPGVGEYLRSMREETP